MINLSNQLSDNSNYILENKLKSDRLLNFFLAGYFTFGLVLATFYDTWLIAFGSGGFCLLAYYGTKLLLPNHTLYQYVGSSVMALFMAQFIYQMHGLFEMHFFAFVASTILITYQKWRLQLPLVILVVLHHVTFAYLQYQGVSEIFFTQVTYMDVQTLIFHVAIAAIIFFICGLWAFNMEKNTLQMVYNSTFLERQLKNVSANVVFAEEISRNNLSAVYELAEQDELGKSLLDMRNSLIMAAEREKQEKFINVGTARLGEVLRSHSGDVAGLAYKVTKELVEYLGANQGGLFILQGAEENDPHLALMGCYAYERRKYLHKRVEIGQGLIGQAYLEREAIFLTNVPENYVNITSGLGQALPRSILIAVIQSNVEVVGVLELASFRVFAGFEITFINKIAEIIAATLIAVRTNEKTSQLLKEAESLTQRMQSQEEEMRQNMEELAATQEEMRRRETETQELLTSVLQRESQLRAMVDHASDSFFSVDCDYRILAFNDTYRTLMYARGVVIGTGMDALSLAGTAEEHKQLKSLFDRTFGGESFSVISPAPDPVGNAQLMTRYTPIRSQGKVTGVSVQTKNLALLKDAGIYF